MTVKDALGAELSDALRRRDTSVVRAVRVALSAIANAEAVELSTGPDATTGSRHVAGAVEGLAATEVVRRVVTDEEQRRIVALEIAELDSHNERLLRLCRFDEADGVRRGGQALTRAMEGTRQRE